MSRINSATVDVVQERITGAVVHGITDTMKQPVRVSSLNNLLTPEKPWDLWVSVSFRLK